MHHKGTTLLAVVLAFFTGTTACQAASNGPVFFVNTIDYKTANRYELARFDGREGRVVASPDGCHLAAPSPIRYRNQVRLYASEHDCQGWHRIVLYISTDGGVSFYRYGVVLETVDQLRTPVVVYDSGVFHLWYSLDRGGLGRALAYADSRDGLSFTQRGVKMWADGLTTLAPAYAVKLPGGEWRLLTQTYSPDLTSASPHLLRFTNPRQPVYEHLGAMDVRAVAPKTDASYVCQRDDGSWWGLFTAFGAGGDLHAVEWTVAFAAPTLAGPWTPTSEPSPFLPLSVAGAAKTSVENPETVRATAMPDNC